MATLFRFAPLPPRLTRPSLAVYPTLLRPNPSIKIPPISASSSMVPSTDRLLSAVSYTLPFFTSLPFCRSLIPRYSLLASPFFPMVAAMAEIVAFFAILLGLARNAEMSVYVRFNVRQALLLDMILTLLGLAVGTPSDQVGEQNKFVQFVYGAISVLGFVSFVCSVLCCVVGRAPYLPFLSSVAKSLL